MRGGVCVAVLLATAALSGALTLDKPHHNHRTHAPQPGKEVELHKRAVQRFQAAKFDMLTMAYSAKQEIDRRLGPVDLEMFMPLRYEKKIYDFLFKVLEPMSDELIETGDKRDSSVSLTDVYSYIDLFARLPPIRQVAGAVERFASFAGGEDKTEITPKVLQAAYRDVFDLELKGKEAEDMIRSLTLNKKADATKTPSIGRCEFVVGTLRRGFLTDEAIKNTGKLWHSKESWTMKSLLYELGYEEGDTLAQELMDKVFYTLDAHPKGKERHLTFCELSLVVGTLRANTLRSFFCMDEQEAFQPDSPHEFEEFRGKTIFPHSVPHLVAEREHRAKLLQNLFHSCDGNGDDSLNRAEFRCFVKTMDVWQDLVPSLNDIKGTEPVAELDTERMWNKAKFGGFKTDTDQAEFNRIWEHVSGKKSMFLPADKWDELQTRFGNRLGLPLLGSNNYKQVELPTHKLTIDGELRQLFREEVQNAWFGQPTFFSQLDKEMVDRTEALINPSHNGRCSRDCWTILAPILDAFVTLDASQDGKLSPEEFAGLGVTVFRRLHSYPRSSQDELAQVYAEVLKEAERTAFELPELTRVFQGENFVDLESFLDPPRLKKAASKPNN